MRDFLERNTLFCLVVALAILLVAVIMAVNLAYNALGWIEFFIVWLVIGVVGGIVLIGIVYVYEGIEIGRFRKSKNNERKEDGLKQDGQQEQDDL